MIQCCGHWDQWPQSCGRAPLSCLWVEIVSFDDDSLIIKPATSIVDFQERVVGYTINIEENREAKKAKVLDKEV